MKIKVDIAITVTMDDERNFAVREVEAKGLVKERQTSRSAIDAAIKLADKTLDSVAASLRARVAREHSTGLFHEGDLI